MSSMPIEDTPNEMTAHPLSWRDIYSAVHESEERLINAIGRIELKLDDRVSDHEQRVRKLESYADTFSADDRRKLIEDVAITKAGINDFKARERGVFGTLRGGQQVLLTIVASTSFLISLVAILSRST